MMNVFLKIQIVLLLVFNASRAQTSFDYNEFLKQVVQVNPLSQRAANNKLYGNAQYKAAKGNYDPILDAEIDNKFFDSKNYYTGATAELKQPLFASNYLKAGYLYGQGNFINPREYTGSLGQPFLGIETSVLQGLFFDKRRAEVIKSKHYSAFYDAEARIQMNHVLFAASNSYVDLLYHVKLRDLYTYFTRLAEQRLKGIVDLSSIGERAAVDTVEASIFYQTRKLDQLSNQLDLAKKIAEIKVLVQGMPQDKAIEITVLDSLDLIYNVFQTNISKILLSQNTNPVLEQYRSKQRIVETEARFKKEMIKPVLNINYNLLSGSGDPNLALNPNNYKWGATFSVPIFLRRSRHEYKMASIDVNNVSLELANKQNEIEFKRKYLMDALKLVLEQVSNAKKASSYSNILVEAERLKFKNGESSLFLLNTREGKWLEAELKLLEYKCKFIKLFLELIYLNGDLAYNGDFKE